MRGFNPKYFNESFFQAIASGKIEGAKPLQKSGEVGVITQSSFTDYVDIWNGGADYNATVGGAIYPWDSSVTSPLGILWVSSDVGTAANGLQFLINIQRVLGTEAASYIGTPSTSFAVLDATDARTPVQVLGTATNILHITDALLTSPAGAVRSGKVYFYRGGSVGNPPATTLGVPDDKTLIRCVVDFKDGKAQHACWAVPDKHVAFVTKGEIGMDFSGAAVTGTQSANVGFRIILPGTGLGVSPSIKIKGVALVSSGTSFFINDIPYPAVLPAGTKVTATVENLSDDMGFNGEFQCHYVDQKYVKKSLLTEINQPGV